MAAMLQQSDRFPSLSLNFTNGGTMSFPAEMPSRYVALLFYRGHW
ncbi:MAG: hypothetical protein O2821_00540 [Chloroflexi bacterium]|nr:hypothetical protein [Chloroflexota bacterium]MDA1226581.1 hypothetical protein [Chloroflexota bacterium]